MTTDTETIPCALCDRDLADPLIAWVGEHLDDIGLPIPGMPKDAPIALCPEGTGCDAR